MSRLPVFLGKSPGHIVEWSTGNASNDLVQVGLGRETVERGHLDQRMSKGRVHRLCLRRRRSLMLTKSNLAHGPLDGGIVADLKTAIFDETFDPLPARCLAPNGFG
jgi:hypothetical protein